MQARNLVFGLVTAFCAAVGPQAHAHGQYCAVLFEDGNYGGHAYIVWGLNGGSQYLGGFWNDRISSVGVGAGCTLTLYPDANKLGVPQTYTQSVPFVGESLNDQASSFTCTCAY